MSNLVYERDDPASRAAWRDAALTAHKTVEDLQAAWGLPDAEAWYRELWPKITAEIAALAGLPATAAP